MRHPEERKERYKDKKDERKYWFEVLKNSQIKSQFNWLITESVLAKNTRNPFLPIVSNYGKIELSVYKKNKLKAKMSSIQKQRSERKNKRCRASDCLLGFF